MPQPSHTPLSFAPYLRPQPWGDRRFARYLNRPVPETTRLGESWELSAHRLHESHVAEGALIGRSLTQLWAENRIDWYGEHAPVSFPWLVKFLDCHEFLSVQVHPNNALAQQSFVEESGKSEAWVVLAADPTARIYAGFKEGITIGEVTERSEEGTVAECLHSFVPRPGDCVYLPAGTVHAIGGGVLVAEVQQTSDATFRLFDWNRVGLDGRPRALHLQEALAAIDWEAGPVNPVRPRPIRDEEGDFHGELLVDCPYFQWKRYHLAEKPAVLVGQSLSAWICIDGEVLLTGDRYEKRLGIGETLLVPPSAFPLTWTPLRPTTLLRVDPADISVNHDNRRQTSNTVARSDRS